MMKNALLILAIFTSAGALAQKHESGKPAKECHAQLLKDCKGVGIGKYCGMKHQH